MKKILLVLLPLFMLMSCDLMKEDEKKDEPYVGKWESDYYFTYEDIDYYIVVTLNSDNYELTEYSNDDNSFISSEKGKVTNLGSNKIRLTITHLKVSDLFGYYELDETIETVYEYELKDGKLYITRIWDDGSTSDLGSFSSIN